MEICNLCKKKVSIWKAYWDNGEYYCPECWENKKAEIEKIKIRDEEDNKRKIEEERKRIKEYKRKCNQCGKVWHSLVKEEKRLTTKALFDSLIGVGTALQNNLGASTQASRNSDANLQSLNNIKRCPNCGSADYTEEIVTFQKK